MAVAPVGVGVREMVGELVTVNEAVKVDEGVQVAVRLGLAVAGSGVFDGVSVGVGVGVMVRVGVMVGVSVWVAVGTRVSDGAGVTVGSGVSEGSGVFDGVQNWRTICVGMGNSVTGRKRSGTVRVSLIQPAVTRQTNIDSARNSKAKRLAGVLDAFINQGVSEAWVLSSLGAS